MHTRTTTGQPHTDEETQLVRGVLERFHFTEPRYRDLFKSHTVQIVHTLRQLDRELSVETVVAHMAPDQVRVLSHDLPDDEGDRLRAYLDGLPDWLTRYLANADEFSLETLRERGWSPKRVA